MNLTLDLSVIIQTVLGGAILVAIRWAVSSLTSSLRDIETSLLDVRTRTARMEAWEVAHDKQDDSRHDTLTSDLGKIWAKIDGVR